MSEKSPRWLKEACYLRLVRLIAKDPSILKTIRERLEHDVIVDRDGKRVDAGNDQRS